MPSFKEFLIYTEEKGYLSSEFTFGFELEGWMKNEESFNHLQDLAHDTLGECIWSNDESISPTEIKCPMCHGHNDQCQECDEYGYVNDDKLELYTFELNSPVFQCTPANYARVIKFLKQAKKIGLRVNASCSFHTHFGLPDAFSRSEDIFWLIAKIASDGQDTLNKLSKFEDIQFENTAYASADIFKKVSSALKTLAFTGDVYALKQCYSDKKMLLLRQHPQGTLEWRGPRNFIQQEGDHYISAFFKHVSSILMDFSNLLNSSELHVKVRNDKVLPITKQQILEILTTAKSPAEHIRIKRKDERFSSRQDTKIIAEYMQQYPFLSKGKFSHAIFSDTREEMNNAYWEGGEYHTLKAYDCFFEGGSISDCYIANSYINADAVKVGDNVQIFNCSVQYKEENHYNIHGDLKQELADWED